MNMNKYQTVQLIRILFKNYMVKYIRWYDWLAWLFCLLGLGLHYTHEYKFNDDELYKSLKIKNQKFPMG